MVNLKDVLKSNGEERITLAKKILDKLPDGMVLTKPELCEKLGTSINTFEKSRYQIPLKEYLIIRKAYYFANKKTAKIYANKF